MKKALMKTWLKTLKVLFIVFGLYGYSFGQINLTAGIHGSVFQSEIIRFGGELTGASSVNFPSNYEWGLDAAYHFNDRFAIASGLAFKFTEIEIQPAPSSYPFPLAFNEEFEMVSIPVLLHYSFSKFGHVKIGLNTTFQTSDNSFDNQSGIGSHLEGGIHVPFKYFILNLDGLIRVNNIFPFQKEKYQQRLVETGLRLGLAIKI